MAAGSLKLLFDENFSHKQVSFVGQESVLAHMQHMRSIGWSGKPDHEWIPLAVRQQFIVITGDRNDRTRGYTVADLRALNARFLLLGGFFDHLGRWDKAKWLVSRIEKIVAVAATLKAGDVRLVDSVGSAKVI